MTDTTKAVPWTPLELHGPFEDGACRGCYAKLVEALAEARDMAGHATTCPRRGSPLQPEGYDCNCAVADWDALLARVRGTA